MNKVTFKSVKSADNKAEGRKYILEKYQYGRYEISKSICKNYNDGYETVYYSVSNGGIRFLPAICYTDNTPFNADEKPYFSIQTTAYGDLVKEDIEKIIAGYNEAIEAVKALTEYFI